MAPRRRADLGLIALALSCISVPACAPGPASAPSAVAPECSAITDDPEELLLRYYRSSGSWCFRYWTPKGVWYDTMVDSDDAPPPQYGARFDPPDRLTHWHGCKARKNGDQRSVKLSEPAEDGPSTAEQLLQFLNPELLAQQELTLLPSGTYAPPDSCVLSGQLPTGEGITYVQSLGDGALQFVIVPNDEYLFADQYPVKAGEPCVFPKCREYL